MKRNRFWQIIFHTDTFILIFGFVFLWFTITLLYDQLTVFQSLKRHVGVIKKSEFVITGIKNKPLFKDTTREMRLYLNNESNYYSIKANNRLPEFDSLFWGDSVNLYTKDKWFWIFGFAENMIVHLERIPDGKVFLDYEKVQRSKKGLYLLTGVFDLALFWFYIRRTRHRLYWDYR